MTSDILLAIWNTTAAFVIPFVAFGIGVYISEAMGLNTVESRKHIYLMALPTGLLTVGILLSGSTVNITAANGLPKVHHGHMQSFGIYAVFCGTLMFYGTAVPQLFESFRKRFQTPPGGGDDN
jgi:hypothetical protein